MSISPTTIRRLVEIGLTAEQMADVVEIFAGLDEERRAAKRDGNRERQTRRRHALSRDVTRDEALVTRDSDGVTRDPPSPTPSPQTPQPRPHPPAGSLRGREERPADRDLLEEFDRHFWPAYPHKVGKPQAQKAWVAARRRADLAPIMDGLQRYVAEKPPDRPWCNPATWLNQDRWADEPAPTPSRTPNGGRNGNGNPGPHDIDWDGIADRRARSFAQPPD